MALLFQVTGYTSLDYLALVEKDKLQNFFIQDDQIHENPSFKSIRYNNTACHMILTGRTMEGTSICVRVPFQPFVYLEVAQDYDTQQCTQIVNQFRDRVYESMMYPPRKKHNLKWVKQQMASLWHWTPDLNNLPNPKKYFLLKVYLPTKQFLFDVRRCFEQQPNRETLYNNSGQFFQSGSNGSNGSTGPSGLTGLANYHVHEHSLVDINNKFADETKIYFYSWVQLDTRQFVSCWKVVSYADQEYHVNSYQDLTVILKPEYAPLRILSFDLECKRSADNPNKFCNAKISGDIVFCIGTVTGEINEPSSKWEKHVFETGIDGKTALPDVKLHCYEEETEMFNGWQMFFRRYDPDVILTYNGDKFDIRYLMERWQMWAQEMKQVEYAQEYKFQTPFWYWSKIWYLQTSPRQCNFESKAFGQSGFVRVDAPGRLMMDVYEMVRRNEKLSSYKLDDVAHEFLGKHKDDLSKTDLNAFMSGTQEQKDLIRKYCVQDCMLPFELTQKMKYIMKTTAMSHVTWTPAQEVLTRGQQAKTWNMIVLLAHQNGYFVPEQPGSQVKRKFFEMDKATAVEEDGEGDGDEVTYQGAHVFDPITGYYKDPVITLDFNSLYPSIMLNKNLCYTTLVADSKYDHLPGVEYHRIQEDDHEHVFVANLEGVLAKLLKFLLGERSKYKDLMKVATKAGDKTMEGIYNAMQLAFKLTANSTYGFTGAVRHGVYPCKQIASSVTSTGRVLITFTQQYVEKSIPNSRVVYGDTDSVMIHLKLPEELQNAPEIEQVKYCFEVGSKVAKAISNQLGYSINLAMEKVFFGFLLLKKKGYCGLAYEEADKPPKLKTSGLQAVRRDTAPFCRFLQKQCLEALIVKKDMSLVCQLVGTTINRLVYNQIPFEEYVLSCSIKASYDNGNILQAHVMRKIQKRTGEAPASGDRLSFVIVGKYAKNEKVAEKAEEANYALEQKLPIDRAYYLESKFREPIGSVISLFLPQFDKVVDMAWNDIVVQQNNMKPFAFLANQKKRDYVEVLTQLQSTVDKQSLQHENHIVAKKKSAKEKKETKTAASTDPNSKAVLTHFFDKQDHPKPSGLVTSSTMDPSTDPAPSMLDTITSGPPVSSFLPFSPLPKEITSGISLSLILPSSPSVPSSKVSGSGMSAKSLLDFSNSNSKPSQTLCLPKPSLPMLPSTKPKSTIFSFIHGQKP